MPSKFVQPLNISYISFTFFGMAGAVFSAVHPSNVPYIEITVSGKVTPLKSVRPLQFWEYDGMNLLDIYRATYGK